MFGYPELALVVVTFLRVGYRFDFVACFCIAWTCNRSLRFSNHLGKISKSSGKRWVLVSALNLICFKARG